MQSTIQIRRGIRASLPILAVGELALCTDTYEVFMGSPLGNIQISLAGSVPTGIVNQRTGTEMKFWSGTKAQYDAISTKDSSTVYFLTDGWLGNVKVGK
jgi:hypothetical protein